MKKAKIALLLALLFSFSCASSNYWKLKIEVPERIALNLNQFSEIVITNFYIKKETKDFDLNQELVDYFSFEMGQKFKGKVSSKKISFEKEKPFEKEDFWKNLSPALEKAVFFTGSAQYTEEIRKAILETKKTRVDDPFVSERKLAERRFYTLNLDLYLIHTKTGEALYKRNFKESKGYKNPEQTASFAFFDLIQRVKVKLFRKVLGEDRIQERYLISD